MKLKQAFYAKYKGPNQYLISPERVARYERAIQRLHRSGYAENTAKRNLKGKYLGKHNERLAELAGRVEMMKRGYLRVGNGMFNSSRHGIDGVFRRFGNDADIAILESKYRTGWSADRDVNSILGRGYGFDQMSPPWVRAVEGKLRRAGRLNIADNVSMHRHRYMNVYNSQGETFFYNLP